jgi:peptidoglycan/LPS O-acetylase OafA/YrhL
MLRALAALLVLLYHLVNTSAFGWTDPSGNLQQPAALISAIGFAGVDLFFVISGLVMVLTCYDRFGRGDEWTQFLKRRVARIYPLYWLATLGVLAVCWVQPELAAREKFAWPTFVQSLLLWPQPQYPIVAVGWTLTYEMFFYLAFAALLVLPRRWLLWELGVWAAITLLMFAMHNDPQHRLTPDGHLALPLYASPLALEFIAGCVIGWLARRGQSAWAATAAAAGAAGLVAGGGYVGMKFPIDAHYGLVRAGVFGGAAALLVYGAVGLERRGWFSIPRRAVFWGDASYSTYLTHMYVLWLVAAAWPSLGRSAAGGPWMATLIGVAACSAASAMCHCAIERPLNQFFHGRLSRNVASSRPLAGPA